MTGWKKRQVRSLRAHKKTAKRAPGVTITPSVTITPTATFTPTLTPIPGDQDPTPSIDPQPGPITKTLPFTLTLSGSADELSPGSGFWLGYQIDNFDELPKDKLVQLSITAPEGFVLKDWTVTKECYLLYLRT